MKFEWKWNINLMFQITCFVFEFYVDNIFSYLLKELSPKLTIEC